MLNKSPLGDLGADISSTPKSPAKQNSDLK